MTGPGNDTIYDTLKTVNGCDSIQTVILRVRAPKEVPYYDTVCQSQVNSYSNGPNDPLALLLFGQTSLDSLVRASGQLIKEHVYLRDEFGNDSIVSFYFTVNPYLKHDTTVVTTNMHGGYTMRDSLYTETGVHAVYTQESDGCDILDVLTLRVIQIDTTDNAICNGDSTVLTITATMPKATLKTGLLPVQVHPGDILCTDGSILSPELFTGSSKTAKGVVFHVDEETGRGLAVALSDADPNDLSWANSNYYIDMPQQSNYVSALFDMDGLYNTSSILQAAQSMGNMSELAPAAYACYYYNHLTHTTDDVQRGWYMPSAGELRLLYSQRVEVNTTLDMLNNATHMEYYYWSSSQNNTQGAWMLYNSGNVAYANKSTNYYPVRAITSFNYTPQSYWINVGDLYTFPDGSQGIVSYLEPGYPQKGWVTALNNLSSKYAIYTGSTLPDGWNAPAILPDSTSLRVWQYEGERNTRLLRANGNSPAAQAVNFNNGWYIPDAVQLASIVGLIPVLNDQFVEAGGSIAELATKGDYYWSSSMSTDDDHAFYLFNGNYGGAMRKDMSNSNAYYIRPVRNFGYDPELVAYWELDHDTNSIKVKPTVTTAYDAVVAFGTDTFRLQSSVIVYPIYGPDTLAADTAYLEDVVAGTITVNGYTYKDINAVGHYLFTDTLATINGCDSIVTHVLDVFNYINIAGTKTWADSSNQDGIRPTSITINLFANGVKEADTTVTSSNSWNWGFNRLPVFANGDSIQYTVNETAVTGYTPVITGNVTDGFAITNHHKPDSVVVEFVKNWNDLLDNDGFRPANVTVYLLADGDTVSSKTITGSTYQWTNTFGKWPKRKAGDEIVYTMVDKVDNYTSVCESSTVATGDTVHLALTNTHIPDSVLVTVTKIWEDASTVARKATTVQLYSATTAGATFDPNDVTTPWTAVADGIKNITTADTNSVSWKVPVFTNGDSIYYAVNEVTVPTGYTVSYRHGGLLNPNGTVQNDTIVNKAVDPVVVTDIPVLKNLSGRTWLDTDTFDGPLPRQAPSDARQRRHQRHHHLRPDAHREGQHRRQRHRASGPFRCHHFQGRALGRQGGFNLHLPHP